MTSEFKDGTRFSHDIVLCTHNALEDLRACLASLLLHRDPSENGRIVFVDDCSDHEAKAFLKQAAEKFKFIEIITLNSRHYYTKAANVGLRASNADFVTLLNSDTIVTPRWWQRMQRVFSESDQIGIVGPLSNAASTQSLPFINGTRSQTAVNSLPPGVSVDEFAARVSESAKDRVTPIVPLIHGFCMSVRRSVVDKIGHLDEAAFPNGYGEETDYCFRASDDGFLLALALDAFVYHAKSRSYLPSERTAFMKSGMDQLVARYGARRIRSSVEFMEINPHLQGMRHEIIKKWPEFYGS